MDKKEHLRILSEKEIFSGRPEWRNPGGSKYFAMYSSVFGGVVTDPALMVVPLDDHMVSIIWMHILQDWKGLHSLFR